MSQFLRAAIDAVKRNGISCTYLQVTEGTYDVETGATINTETPFTVIMYKKPIRTSQYSYPHLIGKDVGLFYLANDCLGFTPSVKDKIVWNSITYIIDSFEDHSAHSQVILYKIVASKG
jgi:hypothetical protein